MRDPLVKGSHRKRVRGGRCIFPHLGRGEREAEEDLGEDRLFVCRGEGRSTEGESRDRGFFSLGFIKWNLKGNIEPEGGFLITSL